MEKQPNRFGGGARTNANGLHFEQTTSLTTALINAGYTVIQNPEKNIVFTDMGTCLIEDIPVRIYRVERGE